MTTQTTTQGNGSPMLRAGRSWYAINKKEDSSAEIRIYEDIGLFGVTARQFADDLEKVEAEKISLRLNTYGGDAFDGIAIYNALRAHPATVVVHVDGIAASAGSIIAMSGDEIRMADNAFLMIHEARGGAFGEADDMRKYGEMLDKLNDSIAGTYQGRAGKTRKHWRERMAEETWYTAEEAKKEGLADKIDDRESAAENRFDFKCYNQVQHVPEAVLQAWGKPKTNEPAPGDSPCGESQQPVVQTQESTMTAENQNAPAPNPAAGTSVTQGGPEHEELTLTPQHAPLIRAKLEQAHEKGEKDGAAAERDRMKQIIAACPDNPQMAIDAFLAEQTPGAVKMAYDSAKKEEVRRLAERDEYTARISRLEALLEIGGHKGVEMNLAIGGDEGGGSGEGQPLDKDAAKAQAEREWDAVPKLRKGFASKQNYVNYRAAELMGKFRMSTAAASA